MSATFYEQPKSTKTKPSAPQKKAEDLGKSSNAHASDAPANQQEQMISSKGFFINTDDLKNGVTLDKVLGGNFKKIDVFGTTSTCKEFEAPEFFPSHVIDEKINELSEPEDGYPDESFEILETENEEDVNQSNAGKKNRGKFSKGTDRERLNDSFDLKNKDICDRINRKYKHKSTKAQNRMRANTRSPECFSSSTTNTQPDAQGNEDAETFIERRAVAPKKPYGKENFDKEIRNLIVGNLREMNFNKTANRSNKNNESKSLSPKIPGTRQSRFQMTFQVDPKENAKESFKQNPQLSATRKTFNKDSKNETSNPFRISTNNFANKANQEEAEYEREDNAHTKKQGFIQAYGMDNERDKNFKTQMSFGIDPGTKMRGTGTKFFPDKTGFKNFEIKNPIEQNRVADRVQQRGEEMLEKYSNRKAVEPTESKGLMCLQVT